MEGGVVQKTLEEGGQEHGWETACVYTNCVSLGRSHNLLGPQSSHL